MDFRFRITSKPPTSVTLIVRIALAANIVKTATWAHVVVGHAPNALTDVLALFLFA